MHAKSNGVGEKCTFFIVLQSHSYGGGTQMKPQADIFRTVDLTKT